VSGDYATANQFIVEMLLYTTAQIRRATAAATDEQMYHRVSDKANSMAWLIWHLSRWQDYMSASVSGERQVWLTEGWAERFALPADLPNDATGIGDSREQVAAFQVDRAPLFGYLEAANRAAVERVSRLTPEQLEQPVLYGTPETPVRTCPAWQAFIFVCGDSVQHAGQINFIRGLLSEPGWRRRTGGY
jgi:hypothetical protein